MAAFNGQRNYGTDRNFVSSFPRNNFGSVSEDRNMPMRRPFERNSPAFQRYHNYSSEARSFSPRPQQSFPRYEDQGRRPSMDRPMDMVGTGNSISNRLSSQNTFARPEFSGQSMYRSPEFSSKTMFGGSDLNVRNAFSRSDMGNRDMCSRPEFTGSGTFSRSELRSTDMFSGSQSRDNDLFSRSPIGSGDMFSRPQLGRSNMLSKPWVGSSAGMFSRPQFNGNPMSGVPSTSQRMQFPYGGGADHRAPTDLGRDLGTSSFLRRNRNPNPGVGISPQKKPYAAIQQNKLKFKPTKKKSKKRNRIPSKMKDDGKKLKPWMTDELYAEVKKKNEMYFRAKAADSTDLWQEFRLQRNKVSSLIKEAKLKGGFITRKKKEDEGDGTEKPFSCDTCDRAFAEESKLEEHLKEHTKCEVNGCQFEAHPKIVDLHKKMQHDTGYAEIIGKLDNAAEIEKWRTMRKSHFPTLENVRKRQAQQEEKLARGEVLETKDFGSKNEELKDSAQDMIRAQQDVKLPEDVGENTEARSEHNRDSCQQN